MKLKTTKLTLGLAGLVFGVSAGAALSPDAKAGARVIQGTVIDSATKRPISNVKVFTDAGHSCCTASNGSYTLPAGAAANRVICKKLGYYCTVTNTLAVNQSGLDVQMTPSGPCTNLEMHPFLYAGEFQNQNGDYFDNQKVYLVRDGKIVWTYGATKASVGGRLVELGDISMKSNGHLVMSLGWGGAREIIPDYDHPENSQIVWSCRADEQVHTAQPVGRDHIFVIDNSKKPKAKLFDQTSGAVRVWDLPTVGADAHGMFRHCRLAEYCIGCIGCIGHIGHFVQKTGRAAVQFHQLS